MLVVDTSAVVEALVAVDPPRGLIERLAEDGDLHVPHLIDIEVVHTLRRLTALGDLSEARAEDARTDFRELRMVRYPHIGLSDRIWALRHNVTAYDGAYIALAEALAVPLITCDGHLAQAPGHAAEVELFALRPRS